MAVRFEQMQPLSPAIAGAYGRVDPLLRGSPLLQRQMEAGNEQRLRQAQLAAQQRAAAQSRGGGGGASAGLALAQRQTEADYANAQRALIADGDTEQREADRDVARQGIESRINVSARDVYLANAERVQQQERAQAQAWVSNLELTHREKLDLERKRSAASMVRSNPELSDDVKDELVTKIYGDVSILEARERQAQVKRIEQQTQLYQQQAEMETQVRLKNSQLDAMTMADRTVRVPTADGGSATLFQTGYDANGRPTYTQAKPDPNPRQQAMELQAKAAETEMKARKDYFDMRMKISDAAVKKATEQTAAIEADPARQADPEIAGHWTNRLLDEAGMGRTWEDHKRMYGLGGGRQQQGGPPGVAQQQPPPGGQPPPVAVKDQHPKTWQPYDRTRPDSMTPAQRRETERLNQQWMLLETRPDLAPEQKDEARRELVEIEMLMQKGATMTPEEQARLDELLDKGPPEPKQPKQPDRRPIDRRSVFANVPRTGR